MTTTSASPLVWEKDGHLRYRSGQYLISHHGPGHGFSVVLWKTNPAPGEAPYDYVSRTNFRHLAEAKAAAQAHSARMIANGYGTVEA